MKSRMKSSLHPDGISASRAEQINPGEVEEEEEEGEEEEEEEEQEEEERRKRRE